MEDKTFSLRNLFMPVIVSSAVTVFLIGLFVSNQLFYTPTPSHATDIAATGSIQFSNEWAFMGFNETFELNDGQGNTTTFYVSNVGGTGNGACNDTGGFPAYPVEWENCVNGIIIDLGGGPDFGGVTDRIVAAINTSSVDVGITASKEANGDILLTNDTAGASGNVAIILGGDLSTNTNVTITGMSGGGASGSAPTLAVNSTNAYQTGSGQVYISGTVNDDDDDNVSIKVEYESGTTCSYAATSSATMVSGLAYAMGTNTGALTVSNSSSYQISGISTAVADEFIGITWDSNADLPAGDGDYCLHLTPYDGTSAGTRVTGTTTIDNVHPTAPGNLVVLSTGTTQVTFTLPTAATSSDTNFSQYKIHYTTGTTADFNQTAHDGTFGDLDLADASFNDTTTTTITGLTASTTYRANIIAYDTFSNTTTAASQVTFTTKAVATATNFSTSSGSTDFSAVADINAVEDAKVANDSGSIQWTNVVDAEGADLDANIVIGDGFVSVDADDLDATFDAPATVVMEVGDCNNYEIYYAANFYSTKAELIANGQLCNANTDPACTIVSCVGTTLTFTVPHFDGFGVQEVANAGGSGGQISRSYTKPSVYQFDINGGVTATDSREVNISFGVSDAAQMAVSNEDNFDGVAYETYAEAYAWVLPEAAGEHTVYARFLSSDGIMTQAQRSITYDPSGEIVPEAVEEEIIVEDVEEDIVMDDVQAMDEEEVVESDDPNACALTEGKTYKSGPRAAVFFITDECTRKRVTSSQVFFSYFTNFSAIRTASEAVIESIPMDPVAVLPYGPRVEVAEGALLKTITSPQVFFIEAGMKHLIMSEEAFEARGFLWEAITDVVDAVLDRFEEGDPIE